MKTDKIILGFLLLFLVSLENFSQNDSIKKQIIEIINFKNKNFPFPIGYVNDYEQIFTKEQNEKLEKLISDYEKSTTNEIAIVTISSIEPYDNINDFATDLSNDWGVGKSKKDNGLVIIISKNLRLIRISTGNNTEKILTDEICKKIIDNTMIPEFRKGEFYTGIKKGLNKLISKWK
ncbi:TPM domain-containing protein [Tenacibaculum caenipelagi]|uniref:TPM domain-containing protein n=1 Tax=Tenacibaculum caenipelagi TaxID=1325435 RepID=A0A4V3D320_9FLAO|nr:TPM domain-containing protein [Tenacibaculum caenipelagi]TDQ27534.1 uncharacterized protein DFQ07_1385 [Tenacibaculum caenipelagi]